ncbi:MAG: sugar transferase [Candidatus Riflebacteria bacterium]|nr:sugar transferase [Candidatus Riflebacteria bacterium]
MLLCPWHKLPTQMRNEMVKPYYDILANKKIQLLAKRLFDLFVASLILVVLSPLFLVVAIAIKLDSKGPVFFRQTRVTANCKLFKIIKFRTMCENAEKQGTLITIHNDMRVTRFGSFLRKFHLDELPQLINIIKGEMSFVGTRPEVVKFVRQYTKEMYATLLLPAGVTSECSNEYINEERLLKSFDNVDRTYINEVLPLKMKINLEAIRHFNLLNELLAIVNTVLAVLGIDFKEIRDKRQCALKLSLEGENKREGDVIPNTPSFLEQTLSQANTKNTIIFIPAKDGGMQATCGMGTKVTCGNCSKRHCEPSLDGVAIQTPFLKGGCQVDAAPRMVGKLSSDSETEGADCVAIGDRGILNKPLLGFTMPNICNQLSVLMSVYKAEKPEYLDQALESVFNQTLKAGKVVLVRDGHLTPELEKVIEKWQKKDLSLCIIPFEVNGGLAFALNQGLKVIHTEYIARMDSDDISLPTRFENQIRFLEENKDIDVVGTFISDIDEKNEVIKSLVKYPITHDECFKFFAKRDPMAHPTVMFRKSFFNKTGTFYDEKMCKNQDTALWHKGFLCNCKFSNIPEVLYLFRRTNKMMKRRANTRIALKLLKEHISKNKDLKYGMYANLYAFLYFCFTQMPVFVKRFAYQRLR